jgi:Fic family protein
MSIYSDVDRLKATLDVFRPLSPEIEARILQKFRLDWNYHSNAIEGNALTIGETHSLLLHGLAAEGKPLRDHIEMRGHNKAILTVENIAKNKYQLDESIIKELHHILLQEPHEISIQKHSGIDRKYIIPGQYKRTPNNVFTSTGEIFYF